MWNRYPLRDVSADRTAYTRGALFVTGRADNYRRLARECLALASTIAEGRATLVEMARIWIRLANDQDTASQMPAPDGSRPAFQQQQQVQPEKDGTG